MINFVDFPHYLLLRLSLSFLIIFRWWYMVQCPFSPNASPKPTTVDFLDFLIIIQWIASRKFSFLNVWTKQPSILLYVPFQTPSIRSCSYSAIRSAESNLQSPNQNEPKESDDSSNIIKELLL